MNSDSDIDSHVHVWTSDVTAYPLAPGYSTQRMQPQSFMAEEYLSTAISLGVRRAVLIQMDFYGYDNTYLLDALRDFPDNFVGVAQVNEHGPDPAREMCRLRAFGVRGVRIIPSKRGASNSFDSTGMHSIWRTAANEQMAICPLIEADDLPALARMCRQYPETLVVIDHAANIGGDGQFRESDIHRLCEFSQFDNVRVKVSAFYYLGRKLPPYDDLVPMIRRLIDYFGPQRLMWGSDSPFQLEPPNTLQASLDFVRHRLDFLSTEDKEWLLQRTAAGVFFS